MILPKPPRPAPPMPQGTGRTQAWRPEMQQVPGAAEKQATALAELVAELQKEIERLTTCLRLAEALLNRERKNRK